MDTCARTTEFCIQSMPHTCPDGLSMAQLQCVATGYVAERQTVLMRGAASPGSRMPYRDWSLFHAPGAKSAPAFKVL